MMKIISQKTLSLNKIGNVTFFQVLSLIRFYVFDLSDGQKGYNIKDVISGYAAFKWRHNEIYAESKNNKNLAIICRWHEFY
jgi:hypothetical protein